MELTPRLTSFTLHVSRMTAVDLGVGEREQVKNHPLRCIHLEHGHLVLVVIFTFSFSTRAHVSLASINQHLLTSFSWRPGMAQDRRRTAERGTSSEIPVSGFNQLLLLAIHARPLTGWQDTS